MSQIGVDEYSVHCSCAAVFGSACIHRLHSWFVRQTRFDGFEGQWDVVSKEIYKKIVSKMKLYVHLIHLRFKKFKKVKKLAYHTLR